LFPREEKDTILEDIADKAKNAGQDQNKDTKYAFFVSQCRERLHLVLTFSPVGEGFRNRCRQFPSIINCCTIDWYNAWPEDALFSVASRQFEDNATKLNIKDSVEVLARTSVYLHQSVKEASENYYNELRRRNYTTPTSYLDLIKTYIEMLGANRLLCPSRCNVIKTVSNVCLRPTRWSPISSRNLLSLCPRLRRNQRPPKRW